MRLDEITKGEFHRKLVDPAAAELEAIADSAKEFGIRMNDGADEYSFDVYMRGDTNFIRFNFDPYSDYFKEFKTAVIERKTYKIVQHIREQVESSKHWVWDTWKGVSGIQCYVIRK